MHLEWVGNMRIKLIIIPAVILFVALVFGGASLYSGLRSDESAIVTDPVSHPLETVSRMYENIEQNNWRQVRRLVNKPVWQTLLSTNFKDHWETMVGEDDSLDYVSFVVMSWRQEGMDHAEVVGRAVWVSAKTVVPDMTQSISLKRTKGEWLINEIQFYPVVDQVGEFFAAVSRGDWNTAENLAQEQIILTMKFRKDGNSKLRYIPYDFAVTKDNTWVKGKLMVAGEELEIGEVNARLEKSAEGKWIITSVVGMPLEK